MLAAPQHSALREPGLQAWPAGVDRYLVPGRGVCLLEIAAGECLELIDPEGGQPCELMLFDKDGRCRSTEWVASEGQAPSPLHAEAARGLQTLLQLREESDALQRAGAALQANGIDVANAQALPVFDTQGAPGAQVRYQSPIDGYAVIAVPGPVMDVTTQETTTAIELRRYVRPTVDGVMLRKPPAPLAKPLQDIHIPPGTASAYVVRAGEYIQVLDIQGRQCSDFQAFSLAALKEGRESGIDATVTRTMLGQAYPTPGLPSKGFSRDMEPLVQVVQDTCGCHDAFNTACNARYYDDLGYPGHVNCSDNFNRALEPYGVKPRLAWEALNFFFNTCVDASNNVITEVPWSRPGDYVLLRALTDLVCVSSSCPDDIDPANNWEPTDIQVRVYAATETFKPAFAIRMSPESIPQLTQESAFHPRTSALTRSFTEYRGFWLPEHFDTVGTLGEYWACRQNVAVMDLSALRKFEITGPDAEALLQWCLTRDMRKLAIGQVVYTAICFPHGGVQDDGTVLRMGEHAFRLVCGEDATGQWLRQQASEKGYRAFVRSSTAQMHNIAVQGPKSRELLQSIIWTAPAHTPVAQLGWFRFVLARIGGFTGAPVVVSRTGYTGELGYEIFCHPKDALTVWDAVWEAGQPLGLQPLGMHALDMLRIEAGLVFAQHEFDDGTDPYEAGIGFTVPIKSKEVDFVGREAILARQGHPRHVLAGLELQGHDVAQHGAGVFIGRARVGVVTSGCYSPILQRSIALARLEPSVAAIGTAIEIGALDGHQKRQPGQVVRFAHYDPDKTRVRA
ncbi:aminomethyltransferase [Lampropedia cohaerens]|uniref:Aminomethyltransferase n=1 Tax=Lampropedia cohaerens TaxID=1610491 RepID=A0A0U1PZU5_9BURK|nr:aminomethyltransferase family protein [Lampropedia cohaerens]KKW68038.1 aminomethyltransferase [Lampropedia cohaerens]